MGHFFTDNLMIKELTSRFQDGSSTSIRIWPTECVEPNDYMDTYVFDVINIHVDRDEFTEKELQDTNPDWYYKHWSFIKQMAEAGRRVYLYSNQWFRYHPKSALFTLTFTKPKLREEGILMTGEEFKLSYHAARTLDSLFEHFVKRQEKKESHPPCDVEVIAIDEDLSRLVMY